MNVNIVDSPDTAAPSRHGVTRIAEGMVAASVLRPWLVIAMAAVLAVAGAWVSATRFAITTDTQQLLTSDSDWFRDKVAFQEAFPQLRNVILAVVDGDTPEVAEAAAAKLAGGLASDVGGAIRASWRPDGGPFFDRNGLLFGSVDDVRQRVDGLSKQAPVLLALAGDPTLRGLMRLVGFGAARGELEANAGFVDELRATVERVLAGERARLSWQRMMAGGSVGAERLRRFVLVDPVLDFDALEPAARAISRIRATASELGLSPDAGVRVRLTGAAPLADEEFATIRDGAPLHLGLTMVAIAGILFVALKSGRIIAAVLVTTIAGLVMTIGAGLLMVGRFNVISVAVAALFLGLGVDFGIQVAVRYRDERFRIDDVGESLRRAARAIGWSLTLAAASLLVGFFAFLPTSFRGVSELGLITGVGMIIAFVLSLTLLPALIAVLGPPGEPDTVETPALAALDRWILDHRKLVIVGSALLVAAGLPLLLKLEFDANPMHLRSGGTEAVATFLDLTHEAGSTPNTLSILAPSLAEAGRLAERLSALPEVARVVTAGTFVPPDQEAKRALVAEGAQDFAALSDPPPPAPPPSEAETLEAIRGAAEALLRRAAASPGTAAGPSRLAAALDRLAAAPPDLRRTASAALTGDLPDLIDRVRTVLAPENVTLESLPGRLREDWVSENGRARVEVTPRGDANDNAVLERFTAAVKQVAPNVAGAPIDVVESRSIIVRAFVTAGALALGGIFLILTIALRRPRDVALTLGPLVIATALTLEAAYLLGMQLNLANIIALPLMLAVGVNFHIYYMIAWRDGVADMLASSLTRAIFFSAMVTGIAFGSLWLSHHPGTASMGKLLTVSLVFTLLAAFIVVPAFLGPPRQAADGSP